MTAKQLKELLGKVTQIKAAETYEKIMNAFPGPPIVEYLCRENAYLTRRVLAAEKLVEALGQYREKGDSIMDIDDKIIDQYITSYREASK